MPEKKGGKKIFNKILASINIIIAIIVLILIFCIFAFGWQPVRPWFQDYYNKTHDQNYQWTQQNNLAK